MVAGALVAVVWQGWAWLAALRHYWGSEAGSLLDSVTAMLAWSPLPPALVVLAAAAHWVLLPGAVAVGLLGGREDASSGMPGVPAGSPQPTPR